MASKPTKQPSKKQVEAFKHDDATRKNIPTAEYQSVMRDDEKTPLQVAYQRRNRDLDPQLVWRGKDDQDWSDLVVPAPPLYIQEKVHPKVLIDDLVRRSSADRKAQDAQFNLFADFNGLPDENAKTEFYQHDANWTNRMILGDSLQVMASLAEREGLRGQVQCIYFDPPYGIKFNSNFQWSTTSREVKDGSTEHITREPEQVKAFRDTWRDGIHSYLTYIRDRLSVARELLTESGSVFVQISDENVHRVRAVMDEVFGDENFCGLILFQKTTGAGSPSLGTDVLASVADYLLWYARSKEQVKYRQLYALKDLGEDGTTQYVNARSQARNLDRRLSKDELDKPKTILPEWRVFASSDLRSQTAGATTIFPVVLEGETFRPSQGGWKTNQLGMTRLIQASRVKPIGKTLMYRRYFDDFPVSPLNNLWRDVMMTDSQKTRFM
jgi:adenine-specific DNA-methyltransferase